MAEQLEQSTTRKTNIDTARRKTVAILRLPAVMARTGVSRSSIYSWIAQGKFPEPISLGPRAVGWLAEEIDDWIKRQIDASRKASM